MGAYRYEEVSAQAYQRLRLARGLASAERILGQSRPEVGL